ncbi:MAG: hypothetical protein HY298_21530 [Verrucomicrobia bacterium]|nr:hypothetical protein [Verrucomicrobiota bacterium]
MKKLIPLSLITLAVLTGASHTFAQGTAFTYQGRLADGGTPANGSNDFTFAVFASASGGLPLAGPIKVEDVIVSNGLFTATVDFGAGVFTGTNLWLEIGVRPGDSGGGYTDLAPRQLITATPYAMLAGNISGVLPSGRLAGNYSNEVTFANTANNFIGNGAGLTSLNASELLSGTVPGGRLAGNYANPVVFLNAGNSFSGSGAGLNNVNAAMLGGLTASSFWKLNGNSGTTPGTSFLGTTDNQPLELKVNSTRALRIEPNTNGAPNLIGGAMVNSVGSNAVGATIGGGGAGDYFGSPATNRVTADFGTVAGGLRNTGSGFAATVGGGNDNTSSGSQATVGGGWLNVSSGSYATVGGGVANLCSEIYATVGGGIHNTNNAYGATIGGGVYNGSSGDNATVGGGWYNVGSGSGATVPGGVENYANGRNSFAAGYRAVADHVGAFVWGASPPGAGFFHSTADNEVSFRCNGGVRFTSGYAGVNQTVWWVPGNASWSFTSDRNTKERISPVDVRGVLEKLARLPLAEWSYVGYSQRHLGPMAQDFHRQFPLNDSTTALNDADLHGVALAAIQGLNQKLTDELKQKQTEIAELKQRLEKLERVMNREN